MNKMKLNTIICLLLLSQTILCAREQSKHPTGKVQKDQILDKDQEIEPGQILTIKFKKDFYDIISMKVQRVNEDGTLEDRTIQDYQKYLDEDRFDLGGCVSYQSQGEFKKLMTTKIQFENDSSEVEAKITGVMYFPDNKKFILLGSDYRIYYFAYQSLKVEEKQALDITIQAGIKYGDTFNLTKPPTPEADNNLDYEPWAKGITLKGVGYIFTEQIALRLSSADIITVGQLNKQEKFSPRSNIYDIIAYSDRIWLATGITGIDVYQVDSDKNLLPPFSYNKALFKDISNFDKNFVIQKIRIVQQGDKTILIAQESQAGLHILQFGITEANGNIKLAFLYTIPIDHIASFDAIAFTLAVTLSSKTYQSGLEIFFDSQDYYINYFEDDEMAVDDVVLDATSRTGIWIGDDVGKGYRHSIYRKNLQYDPDLYADYVDITGNNHVFFFQEGGDNIIFTLGNRRLELFNLTNVVPAVVCSSSKGGLEENYQVTFISSSCEQTDGKSAQTAAYLFDSCEISMNLKFRTKTIAIDSKNIGLIVGLTLTFVFLLVVLLIFVIRRYRKNKQDISNLEDRKKNYMTLESDKHNKMGNNNFQNQEQNAMNL